MEVAISRRADLLATWVAVAFDVDPSDISDYCDILPEGACIVSPDSRSGLSKSGRLQREAHLANITPRRSRSRPKPPDYSRNGFTPDIVVDFTPTLHDRAMTIVSKYRMGPIFTAPSESKLGGTIATLALGPEAEEQIAGAGRMIPKITSCTRRPPTAVDRLSGLCRHRRMSPTSAISKEPTDQRRS